MQINLLRRLRFMRILPDKLILAMKITTVIVFMCCMQISAKVHSQISISERNTPITSVLAKIQQQSGYNLFYENTKINDVKINVKLNNVSLKDALDQVLSNQKLTYAIVDNTIVIKEKEPSFLDKLAVTLNSVQGLFRAVDISGLVLDEKGLPLPGVTVRVKGTNKATSTGNDGKFYLAGVDDDAILEFRMIGYKVLELSAKGKFDGLRMEQVSNDLDETIVVAYGTTTQRTNTGSVTVVKGAQIESLPNRSFDKSLQGLVPGLQITNGTGQPGGGVSNFVLRGITTGTQASFGSTVRNPLIVIDGIPVTQNDFQISRNSDATSISNPMAQLNPSDIETISVLKDAAAIALYGSQASNGVILITTKKGKVGKTAFNLRHQSDFSNRPPQTVKNVSADEYLELVYESYKNKDPKAWTDQAIRKDLFSKFPYMTLGTDTSFYPVSDWASELFLRQAYTTSNEVSMSGGHDRSRFYFNLEYTKQNGIVKYTGYDRKSFRFNYETKPASWLNLISRTTLSYSIQDFANPFENVVSYALGSVMSPLNPILNIDGNYILTYPWGSLNGITEALQNPVAVAEYNTNRNTAYRGLTSLKAEVNFLKHFNFSSLVGIDFMLAEIKEKKDPRFGITSLEYGSIADRDKRNGIMINTNTLQYNKSFDKFHVVNILLGQESQIASEKTLSGEVRGDIGTLPYYDDISSPGYTTKGLSGNAYKQLQRSYFSQGNYAYRNKYFLSSSIRRDGSSKFGAKQKWGTYWSLGGGWVLTEEPLIKKINLGWLSYFKLRGSVGAAGSSGAIDPKTRYDLLSPKRYQDANAVVPGTTPGNPDIRWEKTFTWDAGIEAVLIDERIRLTADFYNKKTRDLIYSIDLPATTGYITVMDNIGDMKNDGVEISLSADILKSRKFRWNITSNWSTNRNVLTKANVELAAVSSTYLGNEEGRNFNSFYLRKWAGVNPLDGKPQWIADETGRVTSTYSAAMRQFVGKPQPDGFGAVTHAFSYENFSLSAQFYYQYGALFYDLNKASASLTDGLYPYINQPKEALNRWTKPGDIATNPRRMLTNIDGGNAASTRYLYSGDYIRLQFMQFSYNLPQRLLKNIRLNAMRLFVQGTNLALWTPKTDGDPDNVKSSGSSTGAYPNASTYSLGINFGF